MSGIEVAGFILGGVPLLISALEHYSDGASTIKSMWRAPKQFQKLGGRLKVEQAIFQDSLTHLLSDCLNDDQVAELLIDIGGELWSEPSVERSVRRKLQDNYDLYVETVQRMQVSVDELKARLKMKPDGKGPFRDKTSIREVYDRFQFGMSRTSNQDLIDEFRRDNDALQRLVTQSQALAQRKSRKRTPSFSRLRAHASSMFGTLQTGFGPCTTPHRASLCLTVTGDQEQEQQPGEEETAFRLILHHEAATLMQAVAQVRSPVNAPTGSKDTATWVIREAEVRVLRPPPTVPAQQPVAVPTQVKVRRQPMRFEGSQPIPQGAAGSSSKADYANLEEIRDLCRTLAGLQAMHCGTCLGYLLDAQSSMRHGLYGPNKPLVDRKALTTRSLAHVLDAGLSVGNSRQIAAAVALGMLRLHDTPWMAGQWGRNEITLSESNGNLIAEHPFISAYFETNVLASAPNEHAYFNQSPWIPNEAIFALGILLIELCMRKPFDDLILPSERNPDGTKHAVSGHLAAVRLLDEVNGEAGLDYGDAVRRCIRCDFDQRNHTLEDGAFRKMFYEGVVKVLEQEAAHFPASYRV